MSWSDRIVNCMEHKEERYLLRPVPLWLLSSTDYLLPWYYWLGYTEANKN